MRYEIGFGVGFDAAGNRLDPIDVQEGIKLVLVEACRRFGGCNITQGQGAWIDDGGNLVVEESRVLVVDASAGARFGDTSEASARELAEFVRVTFRQAAVHFVSFPALAYNL